MQLPHNNNHNGSPLPEGQQNDYRSSSPYPPQFPYQQQYPPPGPQGHTSLHGQQTPYGQQYHEQPHYGQYNYPAQPSYASGYGYNAPPQQHYTSPPPPSHSPYEQQGAYHPPSHSPYQEQEPHPPPSYSPCQHQAAYPPPTASPQGQPQGSEASYLSPLQNQPAPPVIPPPGARPEDDRGFMGALAGGAAGAFAGHKVNHGILGTLGGAFAGHKLEDAVFDHKKHKKNEHKYYHSSSSSSSSSPSPPQQYHQQQQQHAPRYAGNFSASASQISLDGDYDLIASCKRVNGSSKLSSVSLNKLLTNEDGHFRWSKEGNFGATARNVRLLDGGKTLEAELANCGGCWVWSRIVLDEKIGNNDGELVLV